jgi:two-component system NtrC family sensor kinase
LCPSPGWGALVIKPDRTTSTVLSLRWVLYLCAAVAVLAGAGPAWILRVSALVAGALAVYLIPRRISAHPAFEGILALVDTLYVAVVLLSGAGVEAAYLAAVFGSVLLGALAGGLARSTLAGIVMAGLYGAFCLLTGRGLVSQLPYVPLLVAAALYTGRLTITVATRAAAMNDERRKSRELRALLEITDAVTGTLDVHKVMHAIVDRVGEEVKADRCSILLVDEKLATCFVLAASDNPEADRLEIDLHKYPEIRKAIETREPVVIEDVDRDPLVDSVREFIVERGYRSLLVLPMVFGKEVLGTLFLRAMRGRPFTPGEIRFCKVAAGASANALKNALLYRDVSIAAAEHRSTSETLRRVLDCSPDMIVATDNEGFVTEFNRGAEAITGLKIHDAEGRRLTSILGDETGGVTGETGAETVEVKLEADEHETREVSLVSAPLVGPDDEPAGRVWVGRDMTHQRRVERRLAQAERLSGIGELAAGVAHELNNPLSGVLGYAQLIKAGSDDAVSEDLRRIVESARRCQRIVHNLLSFARQRPPEKKFHDLNDCVREVLDLKSYHLRAANIDVETELDSSLPKTRFDYHQLEQVVLNLVTNAEQAIRSEERAGRITLRTWVEDGGICLEVADDGPGIPEPIGSRIFDPFFTTKEVGSGTGLGLSVSYGIVDEHGGRIELRPSETGACFQVTLPHVVEPVARPRPAGEAAPTRGELFRGRRILVAEDEPDICHLLTRLLERDGAEVTVAQDGEEAWQNLAQAEYDLIVADLLMPNLDGKALYERVAAERPDLLRRFVFSTGDLARQETLQFLERLPNRILAKPLDVETVRRVLHQALQTA